MTTTIRDGVRLGHQEAGEGWERPLVLIHGWGCDRSYLEPQQAFFARDRRTISVDLRGHGESDAPPDGYALASLADDVAWQCGELGLERPILVGHSLGGHVALACAVRRPDLVGAVVMIDSVLFPSEAARDHARLVAEALDGVSYPAVLARVMAMLFSPTDADWVRLKFSRSFSATPRHVLAQALIGHVADDGVVEASSGCRCPVAYIGADAPLTDCATLLERYPLMRIERTIGSGHFSPLLVPDQINAMLLDILRVVQP